METLVVPWSRWAIVKPIEKLNTKEREELGQSFKNKKILTLIKTLDKRFDRIINVLKSGMDNAISEAFNNNAQIMKRVVSASTLK